MSRFSELAIALLVLGSSVSVTPTHAATACPPLGAEGALALLARQHAQPPSLLADCKEKCTSGVQRDLMLLVDDIPSPRHLPLSGADEVASWHAEIFELLSDRRGDAQALEYCQLML
jgi:hypothetical protein